MNLQKTLDKLTKRLKQVSPLNEEDVEVEEALSNLVFAYLECNTLEDDNVVTIRPKNGRQQITRLYLRQRCKNVLAIQIQAQSHRQQSLRIKQSTSRIIYM